MNDINDAPVIQLCFCPPMADSDDPEQHRAGCHHAEVLYRQAFWGRTLAETVEVLIPRSLYFNRRSYDPPQQPAGCYAASFGMVHVRPGCRCPR